ncbi:TetR/AcrR family transcriptional regulator [Verrucomicrobiaceae bacterium N1E253]|uniref:TetR/AcrR family transcriptional regulator n=2 Tax=Oceaniferula marina TaxID=2748318 RepID=A0A851GE41_9BACT|nr:TetR/AcrR family transcriptional regulator [Oceaniferula marina]
MGRVLESAKQVFLRYGYRRTTMGDLAGAAEMSRPALYLLYANKEEIFRAVIENYCEQSECLAAQRVADAGSLEERLASLMLTWVVEPYEEISKSPEAGEIYEAGYAFAEDLHRRFSETYTAQIEAVLQASEEVDEQRVRAAGFSIRRVAEMLASSSLGLKREVRERGLLLPLLEDMRRWYLGAMIVR